MREVVKTHFRSRAVPFIYTFECVFLKNFGNWHGSSISFHAMQYASDVSIERDPYDLSSHSSNSQVIQPTAAELGYSLGHRLGLQRKLAG
jgi:hypothetical protein